MDVVEIAKGFLQYGVVGLVALLALVGYHYERKENKELRDRLEVAAGAKGAATTDQAMKFAEKTEALAGQFSTKIAELDELHHEQEDELTNRLIDATRTYADGSARVLDKLTIFVDSVREKRR